MAEHMIDLGTRLHHEHFRWFRSFEHPHFAVTARPDVTRLMETRKPEGVWPYHACLHAVGTGLHAEPQRRMRFRGDTAVRHDALRLSMTVARTDGSFGYAYAAFDADVMRCDAETRSRFMAARTGNRPAPNEGAEDDAAYLSCLPSPEFTSLDNALPLPRTAFRAWPEAGSSRTESAGVWRYRSRCIMRWSAARIPGRRSTL